MTDVKMRGDKRGREQRMQGRITLRDNSSGDGMTLVGYACITNQSYRMTDWLGEYDECVRSGAFAKTLSDQADVRLLLNHDGLPLARTKSGTLTLREITSPMDDPQERGQTGLWCEAPLDARSSTANDIRLAMERGDLDEMSFAFQVTRQEWSPDFEQRDIQEVRLFDVSVVTYPANPATSAALRSNVVDLFDENEARDALARLQRRFADKPQGGSPLSLARAQAARLDLR